LTITRIPEDFKVKVKVTGPDFWILYHCEIVAALFDTIDSHSGSKYKFEKLIDKTERQKYVMCTFLQNVECMSRLCVHI